ncbi:GAF domain-containing protein [Dyadobacter sp.]|uniref:GAF domain-containing protein n=1 Tax=Dyadobacter sp. TaxID=1914288 RepID=UPI003F6F9EF5
MKPLNLLIVSIQREWLNLLEDSLSYAGYQFQIKKVDSKQSAIRAFYEAKYDLLISNCVLPDGKITDLADLLGSQLPCLVMSETHCPVTSQLTLAVTDTNYYMNCYDKLGWIPALENTLAKWRSNAEQKISQHLQNNDDLYRKVLARCAELLDNPELSASEAASSTFELVTEVLSLGRMYLCVALNAEDGGLQIVKKAEASGSGVSLKHSLSQSPLDIPYFSRWRPQFEAGHVLTELISELPASESKWLSRHDIQSLLAVPLRLEGKWIAYIAAEDTFDLRIWSEAEIELIVRLAALIQNSLFTSRKSTLSEAAILSNVA